VWFSQIPARRAASWEGTPTWEGVDLEGMLVADGVWRLRVEAEDYSGRTASVELEVVLDGTGPTPPVLTAPALGAVLTEAQPRFEGTTDADAEVVVTVGARTCAATADAQGSFGCSLDELFPDVAALDGDAGARKLLQSRRDSVVEVAVSDTAVTLDVDTPDVLAALRGDPPA